MGKSKGRLYLSMKRALRKKGNMGRGQKEGVKKERGGEAVL